MKAVLTSFLGGLGNVIGKREPSMLFQQNGLVDTLKSHWIPNARMLMICADPCNYEKNDSIFNCLKESFPMSGLSVSHFDKCDDRNPDAVEDLKNIDVLLLAGGHVPTQNKFMKQLCLRERLQGYRGTIVAWSAGSMNCADMVYAGPELEGEATDPSYERWITGLGITDINLFPHFQSLREDYLDGLRLIEDITFADSFGHDILALNDGSFVFIDEGKTTLHGEAYLIRDGELKQICRDGEVLEL
ncbi:MAG: Type 1 glutamine amidotransferase-like domain-containing protein [Clostridia bacterium]|nr:Type 1 glutamine amidotransferase-like domain-containing protein [Clostridia bacterium]